MAGFRGSDEALDREIETLERIGRVRLRRAAAALAEVDRDLSALRKERTRRRAAARTTVSETTGATAAEAGG